MIGAQPVSADHPVFAGELASRYLAPTPPQSPATQGAAEIAPAATASGPTATPEATGADLIAQLMPAAASETAATPSVTSSASTPIAAATLAATQDFAAASHAESFLGGRGEKFAAPNEKSGFEKISTAAAPEKTFLTALEKRVTPDEADLGIDVAKSLPAMSAATFSNHPATAAVLEHASVPVEAMAPAWMASSSLSASEATGTAHRAVEAVLTAVERFSSGDQHAVNLQFSVGGADLNVRVEMRADEVRTMFRTDSPELRAALAQEWQTVNSGAADRTLRLASPVFSAADHSNLAAFSGDSAPRQRDSGARRAADETFASVAGPARPARFTPPVLDEVAAAASRLIPSPSVLHLHALA